jgi:hypothetical protein
VSEAVVWGVGVIQPTSGFPDASNTGVPPGTVLTPYSGPTVITADDTIVDSKTIGCIGIDADNVILRNCLITCATTQTVVEWVSGSVTLEDCTIDCAGLTGNGLGERNMTVLRCDISGCENGFNVSGGITVQDSYIHDLVFESGAHTDGMQFNQGGSNITVVHNTIIAQTLGTSCIIMWDGDDPQGANILINNNRMIGTGAAYTIYTPRVGPLTNVKVTNNRMAPAGFGYNGGDGSLLTDASGNVDDATGDPIDIT